MDPTDYREQQDGHATSDTYTLGTHFVVHSPTAATPQFIVERWPQLRMSMLHQTPTQSQSSSDPSVTQQCPLRGSLYCEAVKTSATLPFFLATGILLVAGAYFFPLAHNFPLSRGLSPPCAPSCGTGHTPRRQQTLAKHDKKLHISSSLPTRPPDLLYCPPPFSPAS